MTFYLAYAALALLAFALGVFIVKIVREVRK